MATVLTKDTAVRVMAIPSSLNRLIQKQEVRIEKGMMGRVVGMSATGKIAVEFDQQIWSRYHTEFSVSCHGKGKAYHCIYFPANHLDVIGKCAPREIEELDDEACQLTYQADRRRLLLLATF